MIAGKSSGRLVRLAFASLVLVLIVSSSPAAEVFISFNGKFHFTYPDTWIRADYRTVDYYLQRGGTDPLTFQYDVVLSPHEGARFADDVYLILTVDTVGQLSESQIDSVLSNLGDMFGEEVAYYPVGNFMTNMKSNAPLYDAQTHTAAIVTDILEDGEVFKKNLLMLKFYEHGIANFYFYSPDSLFEESKQLFADIVTSFSTEEIEASVPVEEVKVADLESRQGKKSRGFVPIGIAVLVVIAAVVILSRRRRKR
ncbi:MAG TPA: hypothetical protein VMY05_08415 [Acidobacteriota bacterium]|nr:hypothetical protein [Acidobacteriota bacterium]